LSVKNGEVPGSRQLQEPLDQLYTSVNPVIRWLLNRLLKETAAFLHKIDASAQIGLDVGCGEGNFIDYLTRKKVVGSVAAIDLNHNKLKLAQWQYPQFSYFCSDIKKLNFKDNSFDYVIASEVLEHIPRPMEAVREIQRVAKKGAHFIFSVPHEPFFRWGNLLRGQYLPKGGRTPTHVNFWGRSEIKKYLSACLEFEAERWVSVFPWMLYLGRFKN